VPVAQGLRQRAIWRVQARRLSFSIGRPFRDKVCGDFVGPSALVELTTSASRGWTGADQYRASRRAFITAGDLGPPAIDMRSGRGRGSRSTNYRQDRGRQLPAMDST
jgi:hypothetical protein